MMQPYVNRNRLSTALRAIPMRTRASSWRVRCDRFSCAVLKSKWCGSCHPKSNKHCEGVPYEYLDGKTRHRQCCVERFQTNPECRLFLVSLKAGGVGLNLTAAQHVFLLDPWWNPAVEAQAIDRAHRIGQTNQVFAYRLIARGTVEEKVLELQNAKRDLADAIVGANERLTCGRPTHLMAVSSSQWSCR
jgi:hypothetical protein